MIFKRSFDFKVTKTSSVYVSIGTDGSIFKINFNWSADDDGLSAIAFDLSLLRLEFNAAFQWKEFW